MTRPETEDSTLTLDGLREDLRRSRALNELGLIAMGASSASAVLHSAIEFFADLFATSGAVAVLNAEGGLQLVLVRTPDGEVTLLEPEENALVDAIAKTLDLGDVQLLEGIPQEADAAHTLARWLDEQHPSVWNDGERSQRSTVVFRFDNGLGGARDILIFRCDTAGGRGPSKADAEFLATIGQHLEGVMMTARRRDDLERRVEDRTEQLSAANNELGQRVVELRRTQAQLMEASASAEARAAEIATRAATIRRILDNVDDGFLTVTPDGRMSEERSAILSRWLGPAESDVTFADYLGRFDAAQKDWFAIGWMQLTDGFLPADVALGQLPARVQSGGLTLALRYRPVMEAEVLREVTIVVSDVTAEVQRERAEADLRDLLGALRGVMKDRAAFSDFLEEGTSFVRAIAASPRADATLLRQIHTLKGNAAQFELTTVSRLCHDIESSLTDGNDELSSSEQERLVAAWKRVTALLGDADESERAAPDAVDVDEAGRAWLTRLVLEGAPRAQIASILESWRLERADIHLRRLAERAKSTARRLERGEIDVVLEGNGVRLPDRPWRPFFSALVHLVRNAIDHGLEIPDQRIRLGKSPAGTLRFAATEEQNAFVLEIADDGRGIDWEKIRERALSNGLPHVTQKDLVEALFRDGISSRSEVTEISGRGVGMGAVREACAELGGTIEVVSTLGTGTRVRMRFPNAGTAD